MINWPKEPSGMGKDAAWFRALLRCCKQLELRPGPDHRLKANAAGGFFLENVERPSGGATDTEGGRFRGPGYTEDDGMWPGGIYQPYDFVFYSSGEVGERALWLFAWSGPEAGDGVAGPVSQVRAGLLYIVPTHSAWFLMNYMPVETGDVQGPADAAQVLLDSYPNQL